MHAHHFAYRTEVFSASSYSTATLFVLSAVPLIQRDRKQLPFQLFNLSPLLLSLLFLFSLSSLLFLFSLSVLSLLSCLFLLHPLFSFSLALYSGCQCLFVNLVDISAWSFSCLLFFFLATLTSLVINVHTIMEARYLLVGLMCLLVSTAALLMVKAETLHLSHVELSGRCRWLFHAEHRKCKGERQLVVKANAAAVGCKRE